MCRALAMLVFLLPACKDSDATCVGKPLPATAGLCQPGPSCAPCWSCQDFGINPGWQLVTPGCDAPVPDARTPDAPAPDAH
jgi:hypothetical protein